MRESVQKIKQETSQESIPEPNAITTFEKNSNIFHRNFHTVVYVNDKLSMVTLREMSDMKILSEVSSKLASLMKKLDVMYIAKKWFEKVKTTISQTEAGSQVQEGTERSQTLDKFIKIFGQFDQSQDSGDNVSQFSDFSFHFDHLSKSNEDFFDF